MNGYRTHPPSFDRKAPDTLRRVLVRDRGDRDAIASELLRYRDGRGDDWAEPGPRGSTRATGLAWSCRSSALGDTQRHPLPRAGVGS